MLESTDCTAVCVGSEVGVGREVPCGVGVEEPSGDVEGLDDEPHVAVVLEPRLGVEAVGEVCRLGVHVQERSAYDNRPAPPTLGIDAVDLDRRRLRGLVDDPARRVRTATQVPPLCSASR